MRIQCVVLENHRDISVLRLDIVDDFAIDLQCAGGNVLEAGDHTERCGFAASGRTDEDDEFLVFDIKCEILDCMESVGVFFVDFIQR